MKKISVKNYRAIVDSGMIELKPITVALGRNSAGKSSFLRVFPLLKQTIERKTADSILWYGDYVDFGDFDQVISRKGNKSCIDFQFVLDVKRTGNKNFMKQRYREYEAEVSISIGKKYFEKISIKINNQEIILNLMDDGYVKIVLNGNDSFFENREFFWTRDDKYLLPSLYEVFRANISITGSSEGKFLARYNSMINSIKTINLIEQMNHKVESYTFTSHDSSLFSGFTTKEEVLENLKQRNRIKFDKYNITQKRFEKINNNILASNLIDILNDINESIATDLMELSYVKPIRAMVDRYYRVQGINIDELDADGSNLPMILNNLSKADLKKFEKWSQEKFGVIFSVSNGPGHVSMVIKDEIDSIYTTNVADTGYGYSQMLPIVVLLWMIEHKNYKRRVNKTIVIEQPELHLHPAYQAKMIDVFVGVIKAANERGMNVKLLFETHSEAMVNRIGKLIALKELDASWVNILIFEKSKDDTIIQSREFNEHGLLKGWPIGFFSSEEVK